MIKNVELAVLNINIATAFLNTQTYIKKILNRKTISLFYCYQKVEKFNETSLPEKDFYSHLNMEDITDADYAHVKQVCKDFKIKM